VGDWNEPEGGGAAERDDARPVALFRRRRRPERQIEAGGETGGDLKSCRSVLWLGEDV
jgi:hypothetical protein